MKKTCPFCGAYVGKSDKICASCGKVLNFSGDRVTSAAVSYDSVVKELTPKRERTKMRSAHPIPGSSMKSADSGYNQFNKSGSNTRKSYSNSPVSPVQRANAETLKYEDNLSSGKENVSKIAPVLKAIGKIVAIIVIAYFIFGFLRVFIMTQGSYEFDNNLTMTNANYSQALSNYFESGTWKFHWFKNQVYYDGTTKNGDEYNMTFRYKNGDVIVDSMKINGKTIPEKDIMNNYVMGMFMSQKIT